MRWAVWLNYVVLAEYALAAIVYACLGNWQQVAYWVGALLCTGAATLF